MKSGIDDPMNAGPTVKKVLDASTVEVLALTVFRAIFGQGLRVPIRMKGIVDLDLVVRDGNLLLNLNEFQVTRPQLTIWRITFAYHGKPVIEYGRGIKNDMRIHYPQLCILLLAIWKNNRKRLKAQARGEAITDSELLAVASRGVSVAETEEVII
jgi:hypothetical protein